MKPNFALNLSHEGISLLHRAKGGWLSIGEVSLDDASLADELGHLRSTAAGLEAGGMTTKLVIPNSQVLYTEIDAPGPSTADRIGQIRDGLVGLTPYDVRDLVFDWRRDGKRAQVAVVARETLQEAEAFAIQYRFNPISFVASPAKGVFEGEPFFGPTSHAASLLTGGETIQPDSQSIHILSPGKSAPPEPKAKSADKPDKPTPAAKPAPAAAAALNGQAGPPESEATGGDGTGAASKPGKPADPAKNGPDADAPAAAFAHRAARPADAAATAPAGPEPKADPRPEPEPEPAVAFTSRRANGPVATRQAAPRTADAPQIDQDPPAGVVFAGSASRTLPASDAPLGPPPPRTAPLPPPPPRRTPMPVTAPETTERDVPKPSAKSRGTAKAAGAALAGTLGKLRRSVPKKIVKSPVPPPEARAPARPAAPPPVPSAPPATPPAAKRGPTNEAEAMTVFGERGRQPVRGKPRYLGLVLTLILLLALAILALWSTYFMSDVTSGWFGTFEDEPEIALSEPATDLATAPPPVRIAPVPVDPETGAATPTAADPALATEPADTAPPAADQPPVDTASAPPDQPQEQTAIDAAVESALADAPVPAGESPAPDAAPGTAALQPPPGQEAALPDAEPPAPVIRRPLTRPEAEARYAATGIWELDPDPPEPPGSDVIEGLVTASTDPRLSDDGVSLLPSATALDTDQRPAALLPPAPIGTAFDFDERGVVRATTEGAVNPGGVQVFLGTPDYVPPLRPTDLPVPQDETSLGGDQPATGAPTILPTVTPTGAPEAQPAEQTTEATEVARLGGFAPDDLAAIRPAIRPASLWTEPETPAEQPTAETAARSDPEADADAEAEAEADLFDATDLAVAASTTPAVRPQNFGSLVEQALEEAAQSEPAREETRVAVAAPRAPSIPTRASVAKQATEENAINLRNVNLIGVYGTPANRSALVRLKTGRFVKVTVGDTVDGGRVAAIGEGELRYVKSGRNITLKIPQG